VNNSSVIREEMEAGLVAGIKSAVTTLPPAVTERLREAAKTATGAALTQLQTILKNIELAEEKQLPLCQDTGLLAFFVEAGHDFPAQEEIYPAIKEAVATATRAVPLRPNTVNPLNGKNYGDNSGPQMPLVDWELEAGDSCKIYIFPKGGGAENHCALKMLAPSTGLNVVKDVVVEHVVAAGGQPCPPVLVGVAVGGSADSALKQAKKSLFRPIGEPNPDPEAAEIEAEILEAINARGAGPMGLGGEPTALAVHLNLSARHPASFPVGIVIQCWAHRYSVIEFDPKGSWRLVRL